MKNSLYSHLKIANSLDNITIMPSETNQDIFHALIIGSNGTPYQGGFFMFKFEFKKPYPANPPEVTFLNVTVFNRGRIHPNCYQAQLNGKVCLSLIGTWGQNTWDPQTSSIGEILLALLAIVFVDDPLQSGEPPYNWPLYIRNRYIYSVRVLTYLDYIIGTVFKMKDGSFQHEYIEPFKDIILEYVEANRPMYIRMYNELVIYTRINMLNGVVNEDGRMKQAFYQINIVCNLVQIEEAFRKTMLPVETDGFIIQQDTDLGGFNMLKCHEILKNGCQCKLNNKAGFFCNKHSINHLGIVSMFETPIMLKICGKQPMEITEVPTGTPPVVGTPPPQYNATKCCAKTAKGTQCSFSKKFDNFCGKHKENQKFGVITVPN